MHASGSRPPGKSSFNIEPTSPLEDDNVEVLDSLPLGAITFEEVRTSSPASLWDGPEAEWRTNYPYWSNPKIGARQQIGDCYTMVADAILTAEQPYPGDEFFDEKDLRPELRIKMMFDPAMEEYSIRDRLVGGQVTLARSLIKKPRFNLGRWYATRRICDLSLVQEPTHSHEMGHAVDLVAAKLLTDGILSHYPGVNPDCDPEDHFVLHPLRKGQSDYTIQDEDLGILVPVPVSSLENPLFNLVAWYKRYLDRCDTYG